MEFMVLSPDGVLHLSADDFVDAAQRRWPEHSTLRRHDPEWASDLTIQIERPGEYLFQVFHDRKGEAIWTDGHEDQVPEVALWVRSLLPEDPGGRIWLIDEGFGGHVELVPGMTAQDIAEQWVDHAEHPPDL